MSTRRIYRPSHPAAATSVSSAPVRRRPRRWAWFVFFLIALVFIIVVGRAVIIYVGKSRTQQIISSQRARLGLTSPRDQETPVTVVPEQSSASQLALTAKKIPLEELPYLGRLLTGGPSEREAAFAEVMWLHAFSHAMLSSETRIATLTELAGKQTPLTEDEISLLLPGYRAKAEQILAKIMADVALGEWAWGQSRIPGLPLGKRDSDQLLGFTTALNAAQALQSYLVTDQIKLGDRASAWATLQRMRSFRPHDADRLFLENMQDGAWSDEQLRSFSQEKRPSLLRKGEALRQEELDTLRKQQENPEAFRSTFDDWTRRQDESTAAINRRALDLATDQQIRDALELLVADVEYAKFQYKPDGTFVPNPTVVKTPYEAAIAEASWMERIYFGPMMPFLSGKEFWHLDPPWENVHSPVERGDYPRWAQTDSDKTQIYAALELYKRQTGSYPQSLSQLGPALPKNPVTGQNYGYEIQPGGRPKLNHE